MDPNLYLLYITFLLVLLVLIAPSPDFSLPVITPYKQKNSGLVKKGNSFFVTESLDFPETIDMNSTQRIEILREKLACLPSN